MYDGFWDKKEQMLQNSYAVCTFFEFVHSMMNSGIPNMLTLHKPVFDSNWMNISATYFIYIHIFVFHWSILDIVAELFAVNLNYVSFFTFWHIQTQQLK